MNDVLLTGTQPTKPRFSFEVFPARSGAAALALGNAVQHLAAEAPGFIAVTYGANGSHRNASLDLLKHIRDHTSALPLAHLTTVNTSRDELKATIHRILDLGVHDFLALVGDPPKGLGLDDPVFRDALSAAELVELIAEARAERPPLTSVGRTAVAAYPNGHPLSRSRGADLEWLAAKQQAGAQFAITQLFFHADEFLEFVADARRAGVTMPIIPGLMPVATSAQLRKVSALAGQPAPKELERAIERVGGYAPDLGVAHTIELSQAILAESIDSLHLYTFNRHEQVLAVLRELGLLTAKASPGHAQ
ncbi:methylenetetrahydrofolate reductase [Leucobacter sp. UCMA 4100]|uniref:methylenetetrahydrofolate reductase n=1 Tax=Leucobacter sp. UCMA 4100 TaxID=2810534 RepID=UPI0022EB9C33|nr:methylenetetrahydrofolate reductase [Leucobacter sp. UCMA 4100]MDA3147650.1 methylenetetrahydrofolate reductase [Leucobacter sp. UCMA 4100]